MRIEPFTAEHISVYDAASDGRGVARVGDKVVFVEGGIPGDVADIDIFSKEKKFLVGRIARIITPSPDRIEPVCTHFGTCGGCRWQQMSYPAQLQFKEKQVRDAFERIAKVPFESFLPILGCEQDFRYRNKLDFACSAKRWLSRQDMNNPDEQNQTSDVIGFHVPRHFDKVVEIRHCYLTDDKVNRVRNEIQKFGRENGYSFYDAKTHEGYLRNLVLRSSFATGELMLILIVGYDDPKSLKRLTDFIASDLREVTSLITIINTKQNDSYTDLPFTTEYGTPYLTERLGQYTFRVGPLSFFQTNTRQTERLYQVVYDHLPNRSSLIYDLYCGAGSIGIFVSDKADKIVGIEYIASAVGDAYINCELNKLTHLSFHAGDMGKLLNDDFVSKHGKPEVIIADPPRAGMDAKVVNQLLRILPERIIYVSCNPATQSRDIALMEEHYTLKVIQPVDMFPQTTHVENVAVLELRR